MISTEKKTVIKEKTSGICSKITEVFAMLCRNNITVSNDADIFTLPVIVFALGILCVPVVLPAILISLFCGIEYTFNGEDFASAPKVSFR